MWVHTHSSGSEDKIIELFLFESCIRARVIIAAIRLAKGCSQDTIFVLLTLNHFNSSIQNDETNTTVNISNHIPAGTKVVLKYRKTDVTFVTKTANVIIPTSQNNPNLLEEIPCFSSGILSCLRFRANKICPISHATKATVCERTKLPVA